MLKNKEEMTNTEAKEFIDDIFRRIEDAETVEALKKIEQAVELEGFRMNTEQYPEITFKIEPSEIEHLKAKGFLNENLEFPIDIFEKTNDPLAKLLLALAWKQGDLKKIKHIAKGVLELDEDLFSRNDAIVFRQFGRYLTKSGQPIIDQHVIRAFAISKVKTDGGDEMITNYRKIGLLTYKEKEIIDKYISWLTGRFSEEQAYVIDKILFAAGRKVKTK